MSPDPHDELAQARARRDRERGVLHPGVADDGGPSPDQQAAIARAREAWLLRRAGRDPIDEDDGPVDD
jgi:hypothetical protein